MQVPAPQPTMPAAANLLGADARLPPLLDRLRRAAGRCRAAPRLDFFEACALIDPFADRDADMDADWGQHLLLLLRLWGQAIGQAPVFYQPGAAQVSFDERWLLSLLCAKARDDHDSVAFLLHSRVLGSKRRLFARLLFLLDSAPRDLTSNL